MYFRYAIPGVCVQRSALLILHLFTNAKSVFLRTHQIGHEPTETNRARHCEIKIESKAVVEVEKYFEFCTNTRRYSGYFLRVKLCSWLTVKKGVVEECLGKAWLRFLSTDFWKQILLHRREHQGTSCSSFLAHVSFLLLSFHSVEIQADVLNCLLFSSCTQDQYLCLLSVKASDSQSRNNLDSFQHLCFGWRSCFRQSKLGDWSGLRWTRDRQKQEQLHSSHDFGSFECGSFIQIATEDLEFTTCSGRHCREQEQKRGDLSAPLVWDMRKVDDSVMTQSILRCVFWKKVNSCIWLPSPPKYRCACVHWWGDIWAEHDPLSPGRSWKLRLSECQRSVPWR